MADEKDKNLNPNPDGAGKPGDGNPEPGQKTDEGKKNPPEKKEFFLIRGAKAIGRGVKKAGEAVYNFVCDHPFATAALSFGAGIGAEMLREHFSGGNDDDGGDEDEGNNYSAIALLTEPEDDDDGDEEETPEEGEVEVEVEVTSEE